MRGISERARKRESFRWRRISISKDQRLPVQRVRCRGKKWPEYFMYCQIQSQLQRGVCCCEKRFDERLDVRQGTECWRPVCPRFSIDVVWCVRQICISGQWAQKMKFNKVGCSRLRLVEVIKVRRLGAAGCTDKGWGSILVSRDFRYYVIRYSLFRGIFLVKQHSRSHHHYRYSGCDLLSKAPFCFPHGLPTIPGHQLFLATLPVVLCVLWSKQKTSQCRRKEFCKRHARWIYK